MVDMRLERTMQAILDVLPGREQWGQLPYIAKTLAERRLGRQMEWGDMQAAYDLLYQRGQVFPEQDFSRSIIRRANRS
ncbi:MAG TPA: hypothetical protein VJK03_05315 [Candidatus Nanoarchaeia archaeon]|nr:hypothetical protein [Candidatus Nanoarchaeia archaeon]